MLMDTTHGTREISNEEAQDIIRRTAEGCGCFIMVDEIELPAIGKIFYFAGLPFRVIGYPTKEEAEVFFIRSNQIHTEMGLDPPDWRSPPLGHNLFAVEVAD